MENINTGVLGPYQQTAYQQAAFWSRQYQNPMDWHDFSGRNFAIVTHRNFTWEASHHDLALPRKEGSIYQTNIMTPFTSHSVVQNNCMFLQLLALVATLSNSSMKPSMTNYNFNLNYCTYLYTRTAMYSHSTNNWFDFKIFHSMFCRKTKTKCRYLVNDSAKHNVDSKLCGHNDVDIQCQSEDCCF